MDKDVKMKGLRDADQERRIEKRNAKEIIQLLWFFFNISQILTNTICSAMQSSGEGNITSFLEYGKILVCSDEFLRALVWFKRTINMLKDRKKDPFESMGQVAH